MAGDGGALPGGSAALVVAGTPDAWDGPDRAVLGGAR